MNMLNASIFPNKPNPTTMPTIPSINAAILNPLLLLQVLKLCKSNQIPINMIPIPVRTLSVKTLTNGNAITNKPRIIAKNPIKTFRSTAIKKSP